MSLVTGVPTAFDVPERLGAARRGVPRAGTTSASDAACRKRRRP